MATAYQTLSDTELAVSEKLQAQARAADEWECYRHPHAARIAAIADALARNFKLAQQDRAALRLAAFSHDLGILVMQRDYLGRNGPLSLEEKLDLARHPIIGEQEAMRLGTPRAVQLIVRWHHEAWNGGGYPDALQREQIPLGARILHVADAYASLTDERPYRPALTEEAALRIIAEGAGLEFDPAVAQALFMLEDLPELRSYAVKQIVTTEPIYAPAPQPAEDIYESAHTALPNITAVEEEVTAISEMAETETFAPLEEVAAPVAEALPIPTEAEVAIAPGEVVAETDTPAVAPLLAETIPPPYYQPAPEYESSAATAIATAEIDQAEAETPLTAATVETTPEESVKIPAEAGADHLWT